MTGGAGDGQKSHAAGDPGRIRVLVVTVSDTRTEATDESGRILREALAAAGHEIVGHPIVPDEPAQVARVLDEDAASADAVILTGGTGLTARDGTYEVVAARLDKRLDGFGELFRQLSYAEIGPKAMLSRAVAGAMGDRVVFALPGSAAAVRLGIEKLILPVLGHAVGQVRR
jgi:molybdopterin adenylyltransferase